MVEHSPDALREAAPAYGDLEAKRARAGIAAALFAGLEAEEPQERLTLGRYVIESRLGAGGMGVVYRAHDPELDRAVAVKLLHADSATDEKARARMQREARAMAKLSHPNVITVFDVGADDGQVWVAMELVAGSDLRRWLEDRPHAGWREVLELFIAAGRGLAAAHEVALIHRDFKPENVLVGDDGRVRVLDFGLARIQQPIRSLPTVDQSTTASASGRAALTRSEDTPATEADNERTKTDGEAAQPPFTAPTADPDQRDISQLPTAFSGGLTETGVLLGTPLYMAPELYAGRPADERSDQFAFCASLYEGIYRQLPYGSNNLPAHVKAVKQGRLVEPPTDTEVPVELGRIIARGLAAAHDARHRDMAALLAELERVARGPAQTALPEPASPWRSIAIAAVIVAAAVTLVGAELGWFAADTPPQVAALDAADATASDPNTVSNNPALEQPARTPELAPPGPELAADTGDALGSTDSTDSSDTADASPADAGPSEPERTSPTPPSADLHDWCHLHEDRYTLLSRTNNRRASFMHQDTCYTCRVERRRSRTSSFSPRDCAGYSLCGEASASACE
ncbi:serine/threonine protein kinase [Enhygromyxa salina]|uniref:Serine/threonine protein kinase n=1 Tax=Enhygromyxa salina TaxID=215803 RepID=A0A0C1ZFK6_9BACT|nr:serine/threonine-protein kinase [Enhygromyxa salina]KIG16454.1 serine/threonine protein kinase [Enhygromyxa salina]